jgi:hypothetical protein
VKPWFQASNTHLALSYGNISEIVLRSTPAVRGFFLEILYMDRKKLIKTLAILIFFVFAVNFLANKFYWYSSIWYFDMIMHFLGGSVVAFVYFWLFSMPILKFQDYIQSDGLDVRFILRTIIFVFFVGVAWEFFEYTFNNVIAKNTFNLLDTISDIFFDLAGGVFAIFYFYKKIMLQSKYGEKS